MKTAKTKDGKLITASETAPEEAICPYCGGAVTLRSRSTMNGGKKSYYWRHLNNQNRNCSGRYRVV
ncbi:MAG: hypothetical protein H6667_10635 [Ardenticatenaceae bacterium]|nr:hypothetical protein [Ardenticatenaceae bacterium]